MTLDELHKKLEILYHQFGDKSISDEDYTNSLIALKAQADAAHLPFIFNVDMLSKSEKTANDDNEPWLVTLDELDEEPWSSQVQDYSSYEESSSEDFDIADDNATENNVEEP